MMTMKPQGVVRNNSPSVGQVARNNRKCDTLASEIRSSEQKVVETGNFRRSVGRLWSAVDSLFSAWCAVDVVAWAKRLLSLTAELLVLWDSHTFSFTEVVHKIPTWCAVVDILFVLDAEMLSRWLIGPDVVELAVR